MPVAPTLPLATCTPNSLLKLAPCLACLSDHELLALLVYAMAQESSTYANSTANVVKDSNCLTCMSKKQLLQAMVSLIGFEFLRGMSVATARNKIKCLTCLSDHRLEAAFVYLLCDYTFET